MLADRDYMRDEPTGPRLSKPMSATVLLIIINVVVFFIQGAFSNTPWFLQTFALSVNGLFHGYIWQLLTYQFLHGGLMHILLNCWGIFVFGRVVEQVLGKRRFWQLYLLSGVAGGILQVAATLSWKGHFFGIVVGASAGLFGLIAAFATMFPNQSLTLLLFFIIPASLRAKTLLTISAAFAILGILWPNLLAVVGLGSHVAHAAHLGGMLAGIMFIRQLRHKSGHWPGEQPQPRQPGFFGISSKKPPAHRKGTVIDVDEVKEDEYIANQVDPILEKISKHGIHSLTARERKTLEEARKKMGKH